MGYPLRVPHYRDFSFKSYGSPPLRIAEMFRVKHARDEIIWLGQITQNRG